MHILRKYTYIYISLDTYTYVSHTLQSQSFQAGVFSLDRDRELEEATKKLEEPAMPRPQVPSQLAGVSWENVGGIYISTYLHIYTYIYIYVCKNMYVYI